MTSHVSNDPTFVRRILFLTLATCLSLSACDTGDEYNDDGELIERTDVRVTGVQVGRLVDSTAQTTDGADEFLPTDTVFASVRTKGASPKTMLAVRWQDSTGFEINGDNRLIRPTGDTAMLFEFHHMSPMLAGRYTLEVRVNRKPVKTRKFVVTDGAQPRSPAPKEVTRGIQPRFAGVKTLFTNAVERVSDAIESLRDRGPGDQSPFEWRGLRGGMSFTKLDRISNPGTPWKCTPFMLTAVGVERSIALESKKFSAGQVHAIADSYDGRIVDIGYSTAWMKPTDPQRVELVRELTQLASKWDNMPGLIRHPAQAGQGPHFSAWETPDSTWRASISYYGDKAGVNRPEGFEIEEMNWAHRIESHITDSLKAQLHNPESDYYRKPDTACPALLKQH